MRGAHTDDLAEVIAGWQTIEKPDEVEDHFLCRGHDNDTEFALQSSGKYHGVASMVLAHSDNERTELDLKSVTVEHDDEDRRRRENQQRGSRKVTTVHDLVGVREKKKKNCKEPTAFHQESHLIWFIFNLWRCVKKGCCEEL